MAIFAYYLAQIETFSLKKKADIIKFYIYAHTYMYLPLINECVLHRIYGHFGRFRCSKRYI